MYINESTDAYNEAKNNCEEKFPLRDCTEIYFKKGFPIGKIDDFTISLDIYWLVVSLVEEDESVFKLVLDLLNIQCIFFGINFLKLLFFIFYCLRIRIKTYLAIIYLFCLFGSILHSFFIFYQLLNEDLSNYQHQFFQENSFFKTFESIFCFDINISIDSNQKLTYEYLNKLTRNIEFENVFEKISYLNNLHNWVDIDHSNFTELNLDFKIETLFYQNKKCFLLRNKNDFKKENLYFLENDKILKVYFNRTLLQQDNFIIYFLTKEKERLQFSNIIELKYQWLSVYYSIKQELMQLNFNDKFIFIKNPSLLFKENNLNDDKYIDKLMDEFERMFKLSTSNFMLKNLSNAPILEIDDEIFDQYYYQFKNISDNNKRIKPNFQRLYQANIYEEVTAYEYTPDFILTISFFKKVVVITNEDNYAKLILNLLNVLSLWFNLSILDLYVYVIKIKFIFIKIHKLLIKTSDLLSFEI